VVWLPRPVTEADVEKLNGTRELVGLNVISWLMELAWCESASHVSADRPGSDVQTAPS
jgi:hypothetical protein